jgi:hypothetical protein
MAITGVYWLRYSDYSKVLFAPQLCCLGLLALPLLRVSLTAPAPTPVVAVPAGGSLRPVWYFPPGYSLRDLPLVGTRRGAGSCCRWAGSGSALGWRYHERVTG